MSLWNGLRSHQWASSFSFPELMTLNLSCSRWRCHCSSPVVQEICKSLPLTSSWPCVYTYYCGAICHSRLRLLVSNRHHGSSLLEETYPSAGMPNSHPSKLNYIYVRSPMCLRCALIMLPSDVGDAQTACRSLTSPNPKPNCVISQRHDEGHDIDTFPVVSGHHSWQPFKGILVAGIFYTNSSDITNLLTGHETWYENNLCNLCTFFETLHLISILMIAYSQVQHHLH